MSIAMTALLGAIETPRCTLVANGLPRGPLGLTRAQVSTRATALGSDGVAWSEFLADLPRPAGTAQRLLIEGQRTNGVRNPRAEGAAVGVPGTLPTNWTLTVGGGLVREVVGAGTLNGIAGVHVRVSGTTTAAAGQLIAVEATNAISAASGQTWAASALIALTAGSTANLTSLRWNIVGTNGTSATETTNLSVVGSITATPQRFAVTRTLNNAGTTHVRAGVEYTYALGAVIDFTVFIGWPQLEQAAAASTPALPPAGTPGAATRGADLVTATLAALGLPGSGACTLLWTGVVPQAAPASAPLTLLQLDDGTANNRYLLRVAAGGSSVAVNRVTAGVAAGDAALSTMTPGTPFRAGIAIDAAGRMAGSFNGAAAVAVTGGPTSGLTTLRVGGEVGGGNALFGEVGSLRVLTTPMSDAALVAAVAALTA